MSFAEIVYGVEMGKAELFRRLYEVPVPPAVIEQLRPHYEKSELPPEYWFGVLAYRFTQLDMYTQHELVKPFEEYELFCEEVVTPPVVPPWLEEDLKKLATAYMLSRYAYYGDAGDVVGKTGAPVPPEKLEQLEKAMKQLFKISPDFLRDMREFLVAFHGETWYETTRPGGLVRLGFYAYKNVESFAGGEVTQWELLDWFSSVLLKSRGGPMCRQAVYVWPWLKRWFLETFINLKCDEYKASTVGAVAIEVADVLLKVGFLTALAAWEIQRDCAGVEKGFHSEASTFTSHKDAYAEQCKFLRLLRPEARLMELLRACVQPVIDRCDAIIEGYGRRYRLRPRFIATLKSDCRLMLSKLFGDARLLKMFVAYWVYGPPERWPMLAGMFYRALREATAIPDYRRAHVIRALREAGEL